jgi:hypothetical protein
MQMNNFTRECFTPAGNDYADEQINLDTQHLRRDRLPDLLVNEHHRVRDYEFSPARSVRTCVQTIIHT